MNIQRQLIGQCNEEWFKSVKFIWIYKEKLKKKGKKVSQSQREIIVNWEWKNGNEKVFENNAPFQCCYYLCIYVVWYNFCMVVVGFFLFFLLVCSLALHLLLHIIHNYNNQIKVAYWTLEYFVLVLKKTVRPRFDQ